MASSKLRCAGCGKELSPSAHIVRIALGVVHENSNFEEASVWGLMHRSCFGKAIDDPGDALAEIRKLAAKS